MEDETPNASSKQITAVEPAFQRSKTLRLKLATSLRLQAERVAHCQGVSVGFLVTKAIEEKIQRARQRSSPRDGGSDGVHLVARKAR